MWPSINDNLSGPGHPELMRILMMKKVIGCGLKHHRPHRGSWLNYTILLEAMEKWSNPLMLKESAAARIYLSMKNTITWF